MFDQQCLQRRSPRADLRKAERACSAGERVGEADQRIVAGQGNSLMRDSLQLRELIGAAGEEALAKRGEGIGGDGRGSGVGWKKYSSGKRNGVGQAFINGSLELSIFN